MLAWYALLGGCWVALTACSSAEKCTRGEEGCKAASSVPCVTGLVPDDMDICVRPSGGAGGTSGSGGTGGTTSSTCDADDLDTACERFCEAFCDNQEAFCVASRCDAAYCDAGSETIQTCLSECESGGAACAVRACEEQRSATCEEFAWRVDPGDETEPYRSFCLDDDPACVHYGATECSDTCGTTGSEGVGGDLVGDGTCDDGSDGSPGRCTRGTDCSDCGASQCVPIGDTCTGHEDCCGFFEPGAFCVAIGPPGDQVPTCLESCTESGACPEGFECRDVDNNVDSVCAPVGS